LAGAGPGASTGQAARMIGEISLGIISSPALTLVRTRRYRACLRARSGRPRRLSQRCLVAALGVTRKARSV
jgi:hypothetical protein